MGSYFGEVALLKNCKRTASVVSRNYSTCAELQKDDFDKILSRFPYVQKIMEDHLRHTYNDRWRKFIHRALRNVDYFDVGVSSLVINEIGYMLETISINKNDYLFKAGES